jgi:olefin beta-lactone synthetase
MNVVHLLMKHAAQRPAAAAFIEGTGRGRRVVSFAQLEERSARAAAALVEAGIKAGDSVLVFVPMSAELYVALIAIFRIGAVAMFLDASAGRTHINRCCEMISPAGMIAVWRAQLLRLFSRALGRIPVHFSVGFPAPGAYRWERNPHEPLSAIAEQAAGDAALVTFTSGSTGLPKAAVRTHGFLAAQHAALQATLQLAPGQIDLATLPIFTLANLASGVTSLIPDADLRRPGRIEAKPVLRQIRENGPTRSVASPAFFERLLSDPDAASAMGTFRYIHTGGGPVFPGLLERLQRAAPTASVVAVYGSTEAEPIAHVAWDEIAGQDMKAMFAGGGLLAGPPVAEIQLRILPNRWGTTLAPMTADELEARQCAVGLPGEIVVSGAHVLCGYLNGQGDAETKFRVDDAVWHRTGDLGYLDDRNRLWLLGRAVGQISDDLGTLYPFAVECAASQIAGVGRSALIQVHNRRTLVIEADGAGPRGLPQIVQSQLAWASLAEVRLMRRIPLDKRHNAKIDYPELKKRVQGC